MITLKKRMERGKGDGRKRHVDSLCRDFMLTVGIKCVLITVFTGRTTQFKFNYNYPTLLIIILFYFISQSYWQRF